MTERCPACGKEATFVKDHYECPHVECPCQAFEVWEVVFECNKCYPGCIRTVKYPSQSAAILLNTRNALEGCGMVNPRKDKHGKECSEWVKVARRMVTP